MVRRVFMTQVKPVGSFFVEKDNVRYEFEGAEEGGYVVSVPAYPSCVSQGETFEETLANVEDALVGCLEAARDLNLPVPEELKGITSQTPAQ